MQVLTEMEDLYWLIWRLTKYLSISLNFYTPSCPGHSVFYDLPSEGQQDLPQGLGCYGCLNDITEIFPPVLEEAALTL